MFDGVAFGKEMVGIVRGYVDRAIAPLVKRLDEIDRRAVGISEDAARQMVDAAVSKAISELPIPAEPSEPWRPTDDELRSLLQPMVDALPKPEDGKSITVEDLKPLIAGETQKAVAALPAVEPLKPSDDQLRSLILPMVDALPKPQDGKSVTPDELAPLIAAQIAKAVAALPAIEPPHPTDDHLRSLITPIVEAMPKPQDGKSITIDEVRPMVAELVADVVADAMKTIPPARDGRDGVDGKSITIEDVAPLIDDAVSKAAATIPVPKNGKDGSDGIDGINGRNGLDAVMPILKDGLLLFTMSDGSVKEIGQVVGSDGAPGRDGVDGLGFDDMSAEYDGERGIVLRFVRDELVKEFAFTMPVVIDRGVWVEGRPEGYAKGDAVTWAGSVWISQKNGNGDKPDGGESWRLSVKRGRDGKDGVVRDVTQKPIKVA